MASPFLKMALPQCSTLSSFLKGTLFSKEIYLFLHWLILVFLIYSQTPLWWKYHNSRRFSHFTFCEMHDTSFYRRNQTLGRQVVSGLTPKPTLMATALNSLCLWSVTNLMIAAGSQGNGLCLWGDGCTEQNQASTPVTILRTSLKSTDVC